MPKFVAGIVITLALLAVVGQLALPAFYESRVEDRLEEDGGSADVSIGAFPALTLVGGRGKELKGTGDGLKFDIDDRREDPLGKLDGFEEVDLRLTDTEVGRDPDVRVRPAPRRARLGVHDAGGGQRHAARAGRAARQRGGRPARRAGRARSAPGSCPAPGAPRSRWR